MSNFAFSGLIFEKLQTTVLVLIRQIEEQSALVDHVKELLTTSWQSSPN